MIHPEIWIYLQPLRVWNRFCTNTILKLSPSQYILWLTLFYNSHIIVIINLFFICRTSSGNETSDWKWQCYSLTEGIICQIVEFAKFNNINWYSQYNCQMMKTMMLCNVTDNLYYFPSVHEIDVGGQLPTFVHI